MDSCWYEHGDYAQCTLDSSSRQSQRGMETVPGGPSLTENRRAMMLEREKSMIMVRATIL